MQKHIIVIGAGPAGLTSAYLLSKQGVPEHLQDENATKYNVTVLEADPEYVGGLARTVHYKGFHFDIGGHRFFSKSKEIEDLWTEILPHDMLERPRSSRIFYRQRFFSYPLKAFEALFQLGILESVLCMISYIFSKIRPINNPKSFEDWVSNQFGKRLYSIFFKTYTEKVWGMSCKEISADWARQRIKGLSLGKAIFYSLFPQKNNSKKQTAVIKTLIDSFRYPRKGPGMMWEEAKRKIEKNGGKVLLGHKVTGLTFNSQTKKWTVATQNTNASKHPERSQDGEATKYPECSQDGEATKYYEATHVISSAPLREVIHSLSPRPEEAVMKAAQALKYRDFLTIVLILKEKNSFQDNWIYIHDPSVKVGRIQNFKSWSPEMVPDPSLNCYGLEYFCFEGDGLWTSSDEKLKALATDELVQLGLAQREDVLDCCVVRQKKAYPVYDDHYATHVEVIRKAAEKDYPNLFLVGRNGMHKYNNQDHAMMTAMLTVENILHEKQLYNVWNVNEDAGYHEAGHAGQEESFTGVREVPKKINLQNA